MSEVRIDQPPAPDGVEDREALPERLGHRNELAQHLRRLPPGHPSAPVEADGTPRPPEPRLCCRESADASPAGGAAWAPLGGGACTRHRTQAGEPPGQGRGDGPTTAAPYVTEPA